MGVNHDTLIDVRGGCGTFLDTAPSEMIASLVKAGVVDGSTIFRDGTKIRVQAGSVRFRRERALEARRAERSWACTWCRRVRTTD